MEPLFVPPGARIIYVEKPRTGSRSALALIGGKGFLRVSSATYVLRSVFSVVITILWLWAFSQCEA